MTRVWVSRNTVVFCTMHNTYEYLGISAHRMKNPDSSSIQLNRLSNKNWIRTTTNNEVSKSRWLNVLAGSNVSTAILVNLAAMTLK
jgi:hypothetical protein